MRYLFSIVFVVAVGCEDPGPQYSSEDCPGTIHGDLCFDSPVAPDVDGGVLPVDDALEYAEDYCESIGKRVPKLDELEIEYPLENLNECCDPMPCEMSGIVTYNEKGETCEVATPCGGHDCPAVLEPDLIVCIFDL